MQRWQTMVVVSRIGRERRKSERERQVRIRQQSAICSSSQMTEKTTRRQLSRPQGARAPACPLLVRVSVTALTLRRMDSGGYLELLDDSPQRWVLALKQLLRPARGGGYLVSRLLGFSGLSRRAGRVRHGPLAADRRSGLAGRHAWTPALQLSLQPARSSSRSRAAS